MRRIYFFFILNFFILPIFFSVKAANFSFDKNNYSVSVGETVQVKINIDTNDQEVNGADAYINYDSSFLSVESVAAGSFFPTIVDDTQNPDKVYIAGLVDYQASPKIGSGTMAIITFKGLKNGTTNLSFDCNNSRIVKNDTNATNILQCSSNNTSQVVVGSGSGSQDSNSSNSSSNSSENKNAKINTLPKSGVFKSFVDLAVPGSILFLIGTGLRLLVLK